MQFNSLDYVIFLPIVYFLYWFLFNKNIKLQNSLILLSSYVFYGWWDWRFLSLIIFSTMVDYIIGLKIYRSQNINNRKIYLWISILTNISILGFFKYFNFFIESWLHLLNMFGYQQQSIWTINIILPIGISFYTFQTISYSLDIYKKKLKPTTDFISFATFVSFFPQLVAGPIERAANLLPQFLSKRIFNYDNVIQGLRLILWGMFKKIVIADSLAWRVDFIFNNYQILDGGVLLLGLIYFSFQIYCDFSGYSDIAIGTAKLFSINLMSNFRFPYFSRDIGEFWRRWHISLSSWFRDYLYIPLGGSRNGRWISIRNIFIIFIVSGFWHGSEWTFIIWGLTHALLFIPLFLLRKNRQHLDYIVGYKSILPSIKEIFQITTTYLCTTVTWVFFRSDSIANSVQYLYKMVSELSVPTYQKSGLLYVFIMIILDWLIRKDGRLKPKNHVDSKIFRWANIILMIIIIIFGMFSVTFLQNSNERPFIYFQF